MASNLYLVGGIVSTPLKMMDFVSWDDDYSQLNGEKNVPHPKPQKYEFVSWDDYSHCMWVNYNISLT